MARIPDTYEMPIVELLERLGGISIDAAELMKDHTLTVRVKRAKEYNIRIWFGWQFITLSSWIDTA